MTISAMPLIYFSATGHLYHGADLLARCYAGKGEGLNNPFFQAMKNVGPIPQGKWIIGKAYKSAKTGPVSIRLSPSGHDALGRSGFLIHGDNSNGDNSASEGCIIAPRPVRQYITALENGILLVFPF